MELTNKRLLLIEKCSPLLPAPGPQVVEELLGHISALQARLDAAKAECAAMLTKAAAKVVYFCNDADGVRLKEAILALIPTSHAAALADHDKHVAKRAEESLFLELESAVRNHLKNLPGLSSDPAFVLQTAFTFCRRGKQ